MGSSDKVIAQLKQLKDQASVPLTVDEIHLIVDEAIAEIEMLRSLAGQARVSGSSVADIKQAGGRSFVSEGV